MSRKARPRVPKHGVVLVTLRLQAGVPSLRSRAGRAVVFDALGRCAERPGFRIVQFSVLGNHLHLLCEADNAHALSGAMNGLCIRLARGLNRTWHRQGRLFADRYHARVLRTPREVRNGLAYVLNNARRHGIFRAGVDPHSSGAWFDGWKGVTAAAPAGEPPNARARSWLLRVGWRRHGLIDPEEVQGPQGGAAGRGRSGRASMPS